MTTFKQFLTEDEQLTIEDIVRDCKPFLEQWTTTPMWRGMQRLAPHKSEIQIGDSPVNVSWMKKSVRSDRIPRNSWFQASEYVDDYFHEKIGWKPRSEGLFVTGSYSRADQYGLVYMIFPIGQFNFLWSPNINDLYYVLPEPHDVKLDDLFGYVNHILDDAKFQTTDLNSAIDHGVEITIHCKNYYAISIPHSKASDFCNALREANDNV